MYGLNIDPRNPGGNPDPAELRELGVKMVRFTYYDTTAGDEPDPAMLDFYRDRLEAYQQAGLRSLVLLSYDTYPGRPAPEAAGPEWDLYMAGFVRRAGQVAQLLAPWQSAFQVWNEPDHPPKGSYLPTLRPEVYARMLRRTYKAIKTVNPTATVVTAGLAMGYPGWLERIVALHGGDLYADVVACHPYGQRPAEDWPRPDWGFGYAPDLLLNYYRAGRHRPVWITEMGVKEEDLQHRPEQVAEFLTRFYQTAREFDDKVQMVCWFCYSDAMVNGFGLVDTQGRPKPAYQAYRQATQAPKPPVREPAIPEPEVPPLSPPPPVPPMPTEIVPPPAATPTPSPVELAQLANQMVGLQNMVQGLQAQVAQLQAQVNQLAARQTQIESRLTAPAPAAPAPSAGAVPPAIEDIAASLPHHPVLRFDTRPLSQIRRVVIHHTAIPAHIGAERIARYVIDKKGWPGIRYHYFITGDGRIQQTNPLTTLTTHAGPFSAESVGIGFAGDFTSTIPTAAQLDAAGRLIAWLLARFGLPPEAVVGYKELVNTQSPGLQWDDGLRWKNLLLERVRSYLG